MGGPPSRRADPQCDRPIAQERRGPGGCSPPSTHGDQWRAEDGPVARPSSPGALFAFNRYHGGALVLYALREEIGTRAFERLEREWVRRYRDESVGTEDFIALASRVAPAT